jgi:hypothetical protein
MLLKSIKPYMEIRSSPYFEEEGKYFGQKIFLSFKKAFALKRYKFYLALKIPPYSNDSNCLFIRFKIKD